MNYFFLSIKSQPPELFDSSETSEPRALHRTIGCWPPPTSQEPTMMSRHHLLVCGCPGQQAAKKQNNMGASLTISKAARKRHTSPQDHAMNRAADSSALPDKNSHLFWANHQPTSEDVPLVRMFYYQLVSKPRSFAWCIRSQVGVVLQGKLCASPRER